MAVNVGQALSYPSRDESWVMKFAIGGVLGILSFLLIPWFIVTGYGIEVMRRTSEGDDTVLPDWGSWADYGLRGFFNSVVYFVYMLIPGILMVVGFAGTVASIFGGASKESLTIAAGGGGLSIMIGIAGGILGAILSVLLPMASLRYARTLQVGEAFNIGAITGDIMRAPGDYLVCWIVPLIFSTVLNTGLSMVPVIGWLLVPLGMFFTIVLSGNLMGQYHRAHLDRL